jgi:hypothetical protein
MKTIEVFTGVSALVTGKKRKYQERKGEDESKKIRHPHQ